jgi:hypothetical protein
MTEIHVARVAERRLFVCVVHVAPPRTTAKEQSHSSKWNSETLPSPHIAPSDETCSELNRRPSSRMNHTFLPGLPVASAASRTDAKRRPVCR